MDRRAKEFLTGLRRAAPLAQRSGPVPQPTQAPRNTSRTWLICPRRRTTWSGVGWRRAAFVRWGRAEGSTTKRRHVSPAGDNARGLVRASNETHRPQAIAGHVGRRPAPAVDLVVHPPH